MGILLHPPLGLKAGIVALAVEDEHVYPRKAGPDAQRQTRKQLVREFRL
ncbi:MAG: hypothetical protein ACUVUP_05425 [Thermaceae bacterium]